MKKNFMFGSVIVAMLLLGTGCGGGSSSSSNDDSSTEGSVGVEKTGYYLDSAVGGASYTCVSNDSGATSDGNSTGSGDGTASDGNSTDSGDGTASDGNSTDSGDETDSNTTTKSDDNSTAQKSTRFMQKEISGTTNADGSFQFQDGQICTFSIGGVVLRKVNTTGLSDNAIVLEDNPVIARLLQTLDNNDNPDDGILIDPAVSASITSENLIIGNAIPTTDEELANLVTQLQEKVPTYNGQVVTEEAAQSHLAETQTQVDSMNGIMEVVSTGSGSAVGESNGTTEGSSEGSSEGSTSTGVGTGRSTNLGTESGASSTGETISTPTDGIGAGITTGSETNSSTTTSTTTGESSGVTTSPITSPSTGSFGI